MTPIPGKPAKKPEKIFFVVLKWAHPLIDAGLPFGLHTCLMFGFESPAARPNLSHIALAVYIFYFHLLILHDELRKCSKCGCEVHGYVQNGYAECARRVEACQTRSWDAQMDSAPDLTPVEASPAPLRLPLRHPRLRPLHRRAPGVAGPQRPPSDAAVVRRQLHAVLPLPALVPHRTGGGHGPLGPSACGPASWVCRSR